MTKKVKIYTTSTCPYCARLKSFLRENNISFEELDVGVNRDALREMREKSGQMGVPVVEIEGKIIVGFDREKISRELGIEKG